MVYLYWSGAVIVLDPLIVALPLLSSNRIYRTATLFAGMNAGIITLAYFISILRWGVDPFSEEEFAAYFTTSLPNLYIVSLMVGSTIVSKYYLNALTRFRATVATLGSFVALYFLAIIISRALGILLIKLTEGLPSPEFISETINRAMSIAAHPSLSTVVIHFVSAFIALNGTATIMRISEESDASQNDETDNGKPS